MSEKTIIWTKQHRNILNDLEENNRYIVKKEYILNKMEEHSNIYLETYSWLCDRATKFVNMPEDVNYPIWVSLSEDTAIKNSDGNVVLKIEIDKANVIELDIDKWGLIVNYMYISKDDDDEKEHEEYLKKYGVDDITAYTSAFYPQIKNKIVKSWDRLFDDTIIKSKFRVGIIWEVKKEWILRVEK